MRIYISHASNYDYVSGLYEPLRQASLSQQHQFFLPHEAANQDIAAKDQLRQTDLLIAETSYPSTGQGIELGLASAAGVPILCVYREGSHPSGSLRFVTTDCIVYSDASDLIVKIAAYLDKR